jgi:ankyrin repeat protein
MCALPNLQPLAFAAARGRLPIVKLLIDAGADPNGRNAYGDTAFIVAENAMATDKATPTEVREIRAYLLHHGADCNQPNAFGVTPFMGLCAAGDLELVQLALLKGAAVNATFSRTVDSQSGDRNSALMWAASEGQSAVVDLLLQHDADPAHRNTAGETAADWARKNGHVELTEKLANLVHKP